jgi:uncharacterized protein YggU (UPF0235/DUF167 family)
MNEEFITRVAKLFEDEGYEVNIIKGNNSSNDKWTIINADDYEELKGISRK